MGAEEMITRYIFLYALLIILPDHALAQASTDATRIEALEAQLQAAQESLATLTTAIDALVVEISEIKGSEVDEIAVEADDAGSYAERILVSDLGHDERGEALTPRPEFFIQTRYHANPIDEATEDDVARNLGINRVETRWAGRVGQSIGIGFEIQYHPALDGASEELINDAYMEYYPSDTLTVRAGQFVKPFGFDIQHSSGDRESPERGIFAGYFFPGQRDRGVMLAAELGNAADWAKGVSVKAGLFNGNRFFDDNNSELNYNLRIRKVFPDLPLAIGASLQRGTQILPPGVTGDDDEDIYGVDVQYVVGRLGIRAEYMRGNMPSTLLGLEPEFTLGFTPGAESWGAAAFFNYTLSSNDDIYWRWDKFENDPVTGRDIRAFNLGYLRGIGPNSRIGIDYQHKSGVTFNDDELNNALSITWNLEY
jgi:hypothetical protein